MKKYLLGLIAASVLAGGFAVAWAQTLPGAAGIPGIPASLRGAIAQSDLTQVIPLGQPSAQSVYVPTAAIAGVGNFLATQALESTSYCMAGYRLASTLSPSGYVSRGVCEVSEQNELIHIREFTQIERTPSGIVNQDDGTLFSGEERVSMNCWGLTPSVFAGLEELFAIFLAKNGSTEKSEFYIPAVVATLIQSGKAAVSVLPVESQWFGVTYREDRPAVVSALARLVEAGQYRSPIWS